MLSFFITFVITLSTFIYLTLAVNVMSIAILLFVNTGLTAVGLYSSLNKKVITIDLIYWVFNICFFVIAVAEQIKQPYFPNKYPVQYHEVDYGLTLICIWNFLFLIFRNRRRDIGGTVKNFKLTNHLIAIQPLYLLLSWIAFLATFAILGMDYFYGYVSYGDLTKEATISTLLSSIIRGIAFSAFIFQLISMQKRLSSIFRIILASIPLIYLISPFNTTRFITGFFVIITIWMFLREKVSPRIFLLCISIGIIFIFPFLNIFMVNGYVSLRDIDFDISESLIQFKELHFDAFASILTIVSYTGHYGYLLGANFIGTLLFFIPSSIWVNKPMGSGSRIGDYLISNYGFSMDNLSSPLLGEFFLSFGFAGIVLGAILFAILINVIEKKMINGSQEFDLLYGILAGYLFIILRGSLIVAFSSFIGTVVIMIIFPIIFSKVVQSDRRGQSWKSIHQ